jgi:hypothetical protein
MATAQAEIERMSSAAQKGRRGLGGFEAALGGSVREDATRDFRTKLQKFMEGNEFEGLTPGQKTGIVKRTADRHTTQDPAEMARRLREEFEREFSGEGETEMGLARRRRTEAGEALQARGVNADEVLRQGPQQFVDAIKAFKDAGVPVQELNVQLRKATQEFEALSAAVQRLQQNAGGDARPGFASGGVAGSHPGGPQGSDTVPAWLTPGEFVVNRASAQANAALLRSVNEARGPLHLAEGDEVKEQLARMALANPYGASAQLLGTQALTKAQAERRKAEPGGDFSGLERAERASVYAGGYYERQAAALLRRQRAGRFNDPFGTFGGGRPGMQDVTQAASLRGQSDVEASLLGDPFIKGERNIGRLMFSSPQRLPLAFATGGAVPDDVPAYLSRGEFVLSRRAVGAAGADNLDRFNRMAEGGQVGLGQTGIGQVGLGGGDGGADLAAALAGFGRSAESLQAAFNAFSGRAAALAEALAKFPSTVTMRGEVQHTVVLNGAEALAAMSEGLKDYVVKTVKEQLRQTFKEKLPDA